MRKRPDLFVFLASLGAIPFVLCAGLLMLEWSPGWLPASPQKILVSYSLVIGVFMSAIWWGQALAFDAGASRFWMVWSNAVTLLLFFSWLFVPLQPLLLIQALVFAVILGCDIRIARQIKLPDGYMKMRMVISSIVLVCLLVAGIAL